MWCSRVLRLAVGACTHARRSDGSRSRDVRSHQAPRPGRRGVVGGRRRRARHAAPEHHRRRWRPPADPQRRRTVWVVFNGEIYNFLELRRELEAAGHRFYTASDTEVIVHAYEEWGADAVARLRGMFGLAIWDTPRAHAARRHATASASSRCYYAVAGGPLLLRFRDRSRCCRRLNCQSTSTRTRSTTTCRSSTRRATAAIFRGVHKLPPGHLLTWQDGRRRRAAATGSPSTAETFAGTRSTRRPSSLQHVLLDAVRSHLISDVPLGAFLSGGVDSSAGGGPDGTAVGHAG